MKLWAFLFFYFITSIQPIFAQDQTLRLSTFFVYHSGHFLDLKNSFLKNKKIRKNEDKFISKLSIDSTPKST